VGLDAWPSSFVVLLGQSMTVTKRVAKSPRCATLDNSRQLSPSLGYSRQLSATLGNSRQLSATLGNSRLLSTTLGNSRQLLAALTYSRLLSATLGNSWLLLVTLGYSRQSITVTKKALKSSPCATLDALATLGNSRQLSATL
jgi:hypothetical protein